MWASHQETVKRSLPDGLPAKECFGELIAASRAAWSSKQGLLVIEGKTGSGKTTVGPLALSCAGFRRVVVAMPGREMVRSAGKGLADWGLGGDVGQQLRGESANLKAGIVFATYGALAQQILKDGGLGADAVILDEFHSYDSQSDLQFLFAFLLSKPYPERPLVVLASATMPDLTRLLSPLLLEGMAGVQVGARTRFRVTSDDPVVVSSPEEAEKAGFDRAVEAQADLYAMHGDTKRYCILVFLPSREACEKRAEDARRLRIPAFAAHADAPCEAWGADDRTPNRVIFCTSVLEASVTISEVAMVVDVALTKRLTHEPSTGQQYLSLRRATEAQCLQRAGRTGRLCCGRYLRILASDVPESEALPAGFDVRYHAQLAHLGLGPDALTRAGVLVDLELAGHRRLQLQEASLMRETGELLPRGEKMLDTGVNVLELQILEASAGAGLALAGIALVAWSRETHALFRRLPETHPQHKEVTAAREALFRKTGCSEPHVLLMLKNLQHGSRSAAAELGLSGRALQAASDCELELCELSKLAPRRALPEEQVRREADALLRVLRPLAGEYSHNGRSSRRGGAWSVVEDDSSPTFPAWADLPLLFKHYHGPTPPRMACLAAVPMEIGSRLRFEMRLSWPLPEDDAVGRLSRAAGLPAVNTKAVAEESSDGETSSSLPFASTSSSSTASTFTPASSASTPTSVPPVAAAAVGPLPVEAAAGPLDSPLLLQAASCATGAFSPLPSPRPLPAADAWPDASCLSLGRHGQEWVSRFPASLRLLPALGSEKLVKVNVGDVYRQVGKGQVQHGHAPNGVKVSFVAILVAPLDSGADACAAGRGSGWVSLASLRETGEFRAMWAASLFPETSV